MASLLARRASSRTLMCWVALALAVASGCESDDVPGLADAAAAMSGGSDGGAPAAADGPEEMTGDGPAAMTDSRLVDGRVVDGRPIDTGGLPRDMGAAVDMASAACSGADDKGLFTSCSACARTSCETITVGSRKKYACDCMTAADCPCGFRCGTYDVTPQIRVSNICVR